MQHDERERLHWKGSRAKSLKQQTKDDHPGKRRHVRSMSEPIKPTSLSAIQTRDRITVLEEILYSERVYVSCLKDIVEVSVSICKGKRWKKRNYTSSKCCMYNIPCGFV